MVLLHFLSCENELSIAVLNLKDLFTFDCFIWIQIDLFFISKFYFKGKYTLLHKSNRKRYKNIKLILKCKDIVDWSETRLSQETQTFSDINLSIQTKNHFHEIYDIPDSLDKISLWNIWKVIWEHHSNERHVMYHL